MDIEGLTVIKASDIDWDALPYDLKAVWDTENTDLLAESSIDYTVIPYKLKDTFENHCYVVKEYGTKRAWAFVQEEIDKYFPRFVKHVKHWIGQNSINYDHLVVKLSQGIDYEIGEDKVDGREVYIDDTMVMSNLLNPDRPGHSLKYAGELLGFPKMDWRAEAISLGFIEKNAPKGAEFKEYHPRMLDYCVIDCIVNEKWYDYLKAEWGTWDWSDAYELEKAVAEIITRQAHRGFYFDMELAKRNLVELDALMAEAKEKVEPYIPGKPATKTLLNQFTPPRTQVLKNGTPSSHIKKFAERVGGEIQGDVGEWELVFEGKTYPFPIEESIHSGFQVATLKDSTHIKEWLVKEGWKPTLYKEKDLTVDTKKKKLSTEKYEATVERYVEQTLKSPFCKDRCEHLKVGPEQLKFKLLNHKRNKPLKVLTNPSFTVDQEKNLCPNLEILAGKFPYAKDVVNFLTYSHRRNSILGGGAEYEEGGGAEKGFISHVRADGRIPTPAATCSCSTRRAQHRVVSNIPREASLFGKNMRGMFGVVTDNYYLLGADFTSVEAMLEFNYVKKYPGGEEYGQLLVQEKPNSIHCVNSKKFGISRSEAKTVKYLLGYGGQPGRLSKSIGWTLPKSKKIFNNFWEEAKPLKALITKLEIYWEKVGNKEFIMGIDGSKINTRSKHSLLNSLLQSAGAICAKRHMIIFDRKLKEAGISVDFFRDRLNS